MNDDIRISSIEPGTTDGFARNVCPVEILSQTVDVNTDSSLTCRISSNCVLVNEQLIVILNS